MSEHLNQQKQNEPDEPSAFTRWFTETRTRIEAVAARPLAKIILRVLQVAFVLGMVFYLGLRLSDIGWTEVLNALPTSPFYYLFFLVWFFALPVAELFIYRIIWGLSLFPYFGTFLRKRVYNKAIFNYTGEAYLALWAHKALPLRGRVVAAGVKDSTLLSGLATNSMTLIFLLLAWFSGGLEAIFETDTAPTSGEGGGTDLKQTILFSALVAGILVTMVGKFRNSIIGLETPLMVRVISLHATRSILEVAAQAGMWMVVLPALPISVWIVFLSAQLVLTRIPLPNTDLMLVGLAISLSGLIDAPDAIVAGMFLAAGALTQLFNMVIYIVTSFGAVKPGEPIKALDKSPTLTADSARVSAPVSDASTDAPNTGPSEDRHASKT